MDSPAQRETSPNTGTEDRTPPGARLEAAGEGGTPLWARLKASSEGETTPGAGLGAGEQMEPGAAAAHWVQGQRSDAAQGRYRSWDQLQLWHSGWLQLWHRGPLQLWHWGWLQLSGSRDWEWLQLGRRRDW